MTKVVITNITKLDSCYASAAMQNAKYSVRSCFNPGESSADICPRVQVVFLNQV